MSVTEEPTGLLEIRVKIQTLTFWVTPNSCRSRGQRAQKRRFPEWRASSPPKRPPSDPGLNHLGGAGVWLMSHMGPSPFVSAILGEQPWAPRMPTEPYSHLEGQMDKPLPQRAPGPPVGCCEGTWSGGVLAASCHTPTHCASCRPLLYSEATSWQVQYSPGCNFQVQTPGPGSQLRPMKGSLEVGTDRPQVAPILLWGTCRGGWWLPEVPSEGWHSRGLVSRLLPPSPVSV